MTTEMQNPIIFALHCPPIPPLAENSDVTPGTQNSFGP